MKTLEIRMNPKAVKIFTGLAIGLLIVFVGMGYYLFVFRGFSGWRSLIILFPAGYLIWVMYRMLKRFKTDEPVLIFSEQQIEFYHKNKPVVFAWKDIRKWKITKHDSNTYLWISAASQERECQINYLEKSFNEIETLMYDYLAYDNLKRKKVIQEQSE